MSDKYYGTYDTPDSKLLIIDIDTGFLSIDPAFVKDYIGIIISQCLFETLLVLDHNSGKPVPGAAKEYSIKDDGKTYVFYLDKNNKWSNGEPVTAFDFEYTFQRLIAPEINSCIRSLMCDIVNAEKIMAGTANSNELGVKAINEYIFEIKLKKTVSHFAELMTNPNFAPVPRKTVETYNNEWTNPGILVSNGPFILKSFKQDEYILVEKNPYYFNSNRKKILGIKFLIHKELIEKLDEYKNNKIHITCNTMFPYHQINDFQEYTDFFVEPFLLMSFLFLNLENNQALKNLKLRQALYYSIDKDYICNKLFNGISSNNDFVPLEINYYESINQSSFNIEKAKMLMSQISRKTYNLKIIYADFYPNKDILLYILRMWKEILNIEVKLEAVTLDCLRERLCENDFDLCFALIPARYNDPSMYLQIFSNHQTLKNISYNCFLSKAIQSNDAKYKTMLFKKMNKVLLNTLPAFPLFSGKSIYLKKPYVRNFKIFPCGQFSFRFLDID